MIDKQFKIIILAAGCGRRMRPLTYSTHKTLLKIGEKTVIQRIIDILLECGLDDLTIVTGYQHSQLQSYLKQTYPTFSVNYIYNARYAQTNNIHSLALAFENLLIDKDILLIEADLIFDLSVLKRLINSDHQNVALVDQYRSGLDGTVVTVDPDKKTITNIIPPHLQGSDFDFRDKYKTLNIYRFSQEFCSQEFGKLLKYYSKTIDDNCYYELMLGLIIYLQKQEVFAEIIEEGEKWAEIDDPNDLRIAQFIFDTPSQKRILDSSYGGYWNYNIIDFCFIRNMYFPTSAVISEIQNNLTVLLQNYGSSQTMVDQKLATYLFAQVDYLIALNGASQIYPILKQYLSGLKILLPDPCFGEYSRIFPEHISYCDNVGIDTEEILSKINNCNVVIIINPNNPTGSLLSTDWIYNLAATYPEKKVIVDESFIDFSNEKSILPLLAENPLSNVILISSLSKTLGIPGMRLGYVYSSDLNFNSFVRDKIPIWNLNSLTEYFLEIILKHRDVIKDSFQKTKVERDYFLEQLQSLPLVKQVYPSGGNFLLVAFDFDVDFRIYLIQELLIQYRIYVKDVSNRFDETNSFLRLAVRDRVDNKYFIECYQKVVE